MNMYDKREELAAYAHRAWSGWMKWMLDKSTASTENGEYVIPAYLAKRWIRQMNTPYGDLPEDEKESDRKEADKIINVIRHAL